MKQNITLSIDARLLRAAKVLAAKRNASISRLLAEEIEMRVAKERDFDGARAKALALLTDKLPLGGQPLTRDAAHER
jgi:hypothetical protein